MSHATTPHPGHLTQRQEQVLALVEAVYAVTREPCPAGLVGRRLGISRDTVREHFAALSRKGWLVCASRAARPKSPFLQRRDIA